MQQSVNHALVLAVCKVRLVSSRLETANFYNLPLNGKDLDALVTVLQDAVQGLEGAGYSVPDALRLTPGVDDARQ